VSAPAAATPSADRSAAPDPPVVPTALRRRRDRDERSARQGSADGDGAWFWRLTALLALGVFVWLHIEVTRSAVAPRTPWDEIHPLQIARMLSGDDIVAPLSGSGYYPGWAILLTPLWWFTDDPVTVYRAAIVLGSALAAATIIPLTMIGRHLQLGTAQAITAAGIVMCLPGRIGAADYAMSEQALMFFFACAVLGMLALWRRPSWWRLVLFTAAVAATYLTHTRALALVLTALVWMLFFARRRVSQALVGVLLLVVSWKGVDLLAAAINERMLLAGRSKSDLALSAVLNAQPGLVARVLFDQSWAQVVGTAGLFALGAVVVVVWMLREVRTLLLGPGAFLFGLTLSSVGMSVLWWTRPDILWNRSHPRLDAWLYTRYIDQVAVFLALVAIVVLIRRVSVPMILIALGAFVLGAIGVIVRVAPDVPLWGVISTSSSAVNSWQGMFPDAEFARPLPPTLTSVNSFWWWASLFAALCLLAMLVLRRAPRIAVVLLLVIAGVLSWTGDLDQRRSPPVKIGATLEQVDAAAGGEGMVPVDVDYSCRRTGLTKDQMLNWSGYWFSPREVRFADPPKGQPFASDLIISCHDNAALRDRGALRVEGDVNYGYRLWVLPGGLQDELSDAGLLEGR
jgi:hypothetical protein